VLASHALAAVRLVAALLVAGVLAACGSRSAAVEPASEQTLVRHGDRITVPPNSPLRSRLRIESVQSENVRRSLEAPAQVEADPARLARITPPLAGRIVRLHVRFGDTVRQGQPLLDLDSPDLVAAQSEYLRARSALAQSERTLARQRDLTSHGIGAQREVEQAQTDRDLARSELDRAGLRLRLLGIDAGALGRPLTVRSPIAGRVVEYRVAPGEYHSDPSTVLMTIADLSTVWVTANVQEKDVRRVHVREDASAAFAAYPGERWPGHVLFVGDLLEPETRSIKVRIAFDNPDGRLRPGMFASVTFTETAASEVVVPATALVLLGDANFAFVETEPGVLQRRRIGLGAQVGNLVVVNDGLRAGERVVVENAVLLQ
jgi:cobalt-zinc-cadmium efflux system membrane fusion protein